LIFEFSLFGKFSSYSLGTTILLFTSELLIGIEALLI